jgi:hypothetical protein
MFGSKVKWDPGNGAQYIYYNAPGLNIAVLDFVEFKPGRKSMDEFIGNLIDEQFRTDNPSLHVLPMGSMKIMANDVEYTAFMRAFSSTSANTYEVAAFIPSGLTVIVVVASAPDYDYFKANSGPYFDLLAKHVNPDGR